MKKILIGCFVLLAVGAIGAGAASFMVYRKVSSTVSGFAELGASVPAIEREVRNQRPFVPPTTGEATGSQVRGGGAAGCQGPPGETGR